MSFWNPFSWEVDKTTELEKTLSEDGKEKYEKFADFPIEVNTEIDLKESPEDKLVFYVHDGEVKFDYTVSNAENFSAILSTIYEPERMKEVLDMLVYDLDERLQEQKLDNVQFLTLTLGLITSKLNKNTALIRPSEYEP